MSVEPDTVEQTEKTAPPAAVTQSPSTQPAKPPADATPDAPAATTSDGPQIASSTEGETTPPPAVSPTPEPAPPEQPSTVSESSPSADSATVAAEAPPSEPPSQRLQIGSKRSDADNAELKPKPTAPVAGSTTTTVEPPRKNYPPPNIRDRLSPELEQEFQDALEGTSLEDLIATSEAETAAAELAPDTKVTAKVASLHGEDVFLDLGGRNQGVMPVKQFETPPEVGAEVDVVVARFNNEQGLYEVSLPSAAVSVGNWDDVEEGQIIDVAITGANKGGLECQVSGIRGFIPMGQISLFRVENAEEYVGQRLACVVTEANRSRKNLVLSHRALMERERKEKREQLLAELAPGQTREGVVRSLQDFGAFVDLGGIDGLIHVSQLSWDRVGHPKEVLQVGQTVTVRVEKVDAETGKIGLAYRDLAANPWDEAPAKFPVGSTVKGTVTKLMQFGAFVRLTAGVEGLIHISELGHGRVFRTGDVVSEGQEVEVKVLSVDPESQRIGLSLKALMEKPPTPGKKQDEAPAEENAPPRRDRRQEDSQLKGGLGGPSGGDKFGLKW